MQYVVCCENQIYFKQIQAYSLADLLTLLGTGGSGSAKTPERFLARNCITKFSVEKFNSHVNSLFLPTHWMAKIFFCAEREIAEIQTLGPARPPRSSTVRNFSAIHFVLKKNKSCCKLVIQLVFNIIFHFYKNDHGWKREFGELWTL